MTSAKVAVTLDRGLLGEIDRWVAEGEFPNRSRVFQEAIRSFRLTRHRRHRLLRELAKLDPEEERALADEALAGEDTWLAS